MNSFLKLSSNNYIVPDMLRSHRMKNINAPKPAKDDNIQKNGTAHPIMARTIAAPRKINHNIKYLCVLSLEAFCAFIVAFANIFVLMLPFASMLFLNFL